MQPSSHNWPRDTRDALLSPGRTIALDPVGEMCWDSGTWPTFVDLMLVLFGSCTGGPFELRTEDKR